MNWTLEAEASAAAIVNEFTTTFYIPKTFNVKALTNRIAGAIQRSEDAAREAGRKDGIEEAAEFIAGFADVNKTHGQVARRLEECLRSMA